MNREDFFDKNGVVMPLEDASSIRGLFGPYRCFSNFHHFPFEFDGLVYHTAEAAYMAQKSDEPGMRAEFARYTTGKEAKAAGRTVKLRPNWDDIHRIHAMYRVVLEKFSQDHESAAVLLGTGSKYIEETNWWKDRYWGVDGVGYNHLGRILMTVRTHLRRHHQ